MRLRSFVGFGAIVVAAAMLSGCSAGAPQAISAKSIPAVNASPTAVVPAGSWTRVNDSDANKGQSYALRIVSVVKGEAGEFKKSKDLFGGSDDGGPSLKTGVPFYISVQFAVVHGIAYDTPSWNQFVVHDASDDAKVTSLSVSEDDTRCSPAETNSSPENLRVLQTFCVVALADPGAVPTSITYEAGSGKSTANPDGILATMGLPKPRAG